MTSKIFASTLLSAALITGAAGQASADIGDAIVGGIIGGIIVHGAEQNRPRRVVVVDTSARQLARDIQTALNHFYFNVGAPDGVLGRQSRAGISQFQLYLGYAATGDLTEFQRQVLISAYQRAQLGGPQVIQVSQTHQDGLRGLLQVVRDEMMGVPQQNTVTVAAPAPATPTAGMPNFLGGAGGTQQVSLASHCNRVGLITSSNGGYTDLGTLRDPVFTLNEQFCLARGYAIADGESLMAQLGVASQDVAGQCAGIGNALQQQIAALALQPRDAVLASTMQWVLTAGMTTQVAFQPGPASRNQLILAAVDMANNGAQPTAPIAPAAGK